VRAEKLLLYAAASSEWPPSVIALFVSERDDAWSYEEYEMF